MADWRSLMPPFQSEPTGQETELARSPVASPPSISAAEASAAESSEKPTLRSDSFEPISNLAERDAAPSRTSWLAFLGLFCVLLIGAIDFTTGPEISLALFYVPPVAMATWFGGRRLGLVAAVASALASFTARVPEGAQFSHLLTDSWNAATRLLIFSLGVWLLTVVRQQQDRLQKTIERKSAGLELAMAERALAEREVLEAGAREQKRIAYDLHDDLGQQLVGIAFKAKLLSDKLQSNNPGEAEEAATIARLANDAARQTRLTARKLDNAASAADLKTTLPKLAAAIQETCRVRVSVNTSAYSIPVGVPVAVQLYRIAQEAVHNAVEPGRADAVEIYLVSHPPHVVLTVRDTGCGYDDASVAEQGMGFRIMGSRAQSVGGSCEVQSRQGGVTLICRVPIDGEPASRS
jgi:signal transduction histidine kinase